MTKVGDFRRNNAENIYRMVYSFLEPGQWLYQGGVRAVTTVMRSGLPTGGKAHLRFLSGSTCFSVTPIS